MIIIFQKLNEGQNLKLDNLAENLQELVLTTVCRTYQYDKLVRALEQNRLVQKVTLRTCPGKIAALQVDLNDNSSKGFKSKLVFKESDYEPESCIKDELFAFKNGL